MAQTGSHQGGAGSGIPAHQGRHSALVSQLGCAPDYVQKLRADFRLVAASGILPQLEF